MKINQTTRIIGKNVILVPYREKHVLRYHEWMKSPELQTLTASEPLSLEEEYQMQKSWLEDEDKCTFIILNKEKYQETEDETAMIGDTNLFFNNPDCPKTAEAEIMIAEVQDRGKKLGWEAMILMFRYGIEKLNVSKYEVKISFTNTRSIQMFSKLGFNEVTRSDVFKEVTLAKNVNDEWIQWLMQETTTCIMNEYSN